MIRMKIDEISDHILLKCLLFYLQACKMDSVSGKQVV